jgi:hypothetical protein
MPGHKNTLGHNEYREGHARAGSEVDDDVDARIQLHTEPRTNSSRQTVGVWLH